MLGVFLTPETERSTCGRTAWTMGCREPPVGVTFAGEGGDPSSCGSWFGCSSLLVGVGGRCAGGAPAGAPPLTACASTSGELTKDVQITNTPSIAIDENAAT